MTAIGTTRVQDVMVTKLITVKETDKMEQVANSFKEHDINAAPVITQHGQCVGIITSHDVVEYESSRTAVMKEFCTSKYGQQLFVAEDKFRMPGTRYDEAGFHMSTSLETVNPNDPLSKVARKMCQRHIHHIIVLDDDQRPIGFLSSLDLLGFIVGEPVCRSAVCPVN